MSPIIDAMKRGDYFWTSGEVLIPSVPRRRAPARSAPITADVEWTFPLDFVEVVWGDGQKTERQIISTTDLPAFGQATDSGSRSTPPVRNGCGLRHGTRRATARCVQPIKLTGATTTTTSR